MKYSNKKHTEISVVLHTEISVVLSNSPLAMETLYQCYPSIFIGMI